MANDPCAMGWSKAAGDVSGERLAAEGSGRSPILPVTEAAARNREQRYEGRYECLQECKRSRTDEEYARASATARERSGCLVLTPDVIAIDVPDGRGTDREHSGILLGFSRVRAYPSNRSRPDSDIRVPLIRGDDNHVEITVTTCRDSPSIVSLWNTALQRCGRPRRGTRGAFPARSTGMSDRR